jgi:hypothetical protein
MLDRPALDVRTAPLLINTGYLEKLESCPRADALHDPQPGQPRGDCPYLNR